jgi:hypothetical protein
VLFAVDVAGSARRDDKAQLSMRRALWAVLTEAFEDSQIGWENCHREDRGDGVLVIIPATTRSAAILNPLLDRLHAGLRHHNEVSSEAAKIRLRVAVHSGLVHRDQYGLVGNAFVHVFRLLDAPALRQALASSGGDLALIVSDHFYDTVIRYGPGPIDAGTFRPATVAVKETRTRGWLHLPQLSPRVPQLHCDPRSADDHVRPPEVEQGPAATSVAPEVLSFRWIPAGR